MKYIYWKCIQHFQECEICVIQHFSQQLMLSPKMFYIPPLLHSVWVIFHVKSTQKIPIVIKLVIGHILMSTLSRHVYEGHTDPNALPSGKYMVDYLHISPNCHCILSSITESHGSPKTYFIALKEKAPKSIQEKIIRIKTSVFERAKVKEHYDDL